MNRLANKVENLILQTYNYKEVLSYIAENDELVSVRNLLREQIQERNAFIIELQDIYSNLILKNNVVNSVKEELNFWIDHNDLESIKCEAEILANIIECNKKILLDYKSVIKEIILKPNYFNLINLQKEKIKHSLKYMKSIV